MVTYSDDKKENHSPGTAVEEKTVWYLAYGSNMDPKVFTGRRKIHPIESRPVIVPEYWLSFDIGGLPYLEPCFASILKKDSSRIHERAYALEVHARTLEGRPFVWDDRHPENSYPPTLQGVAHRITLREWQLVIQSEGGWGYDLPTGYDQIEVECMVVENGTNPTGETLRTKVLEARPKSIRSHCQPSARYKSLLVTGAAYHNIDPAYQRYLSQVVPYECTGLKAKMGRVVFSIANLPMLIFFFGMGNRGKRPEDLTKPPYWAAWTQDKMARFSATLYDNVIGPIFGSGRSSTRAQQRLAWRQINAEMDVSLKELDVKARQSLDQEPLILKAAEELVESTAE
ncbi:hypothetical protein BGW38_004596 [Lunasporangiospora selenospora]|uniref:gamma-glutamylcyclotransferase n=1 Tax=Lunasporangiospora selenospora TaxID=979761 RepID=A0A9P6FPX4_9FUNG|nr:hypothetical protein BGW38_004596 [Lunasporangiospora selenospora]